MGRRTTRSGATLRGSRDSCADSQPVVAQRTTGKQLTMRLIDLSQPVFDGCPNCPAHPAVRIDVISSHADVGTETWHMEKLTLASHTGSHVDAPLHKIPSGASLDDIPIERWHGPAHVIDLRGIAA